MGIVRMGPPEDIVLKFKTAFGIETFVETGTYYGNTTLWAAQSFKHVLTVEFSEKIFAENKLKFQKFPNIQATFGDSRDFLRAELAYMKSPAIFWLDAHWCSGDSYGLEDQCPLMQELALFDAFETEHLILIDDARLFCSPPPKPNSLDQYPDLSSILKLLSRKNYVAIVDDVMIAVPLRLEKEVKQYLQERNTADWVKRGKELEKVGLLKSLIRRVVLKTGFFN